VYQKKKKLKEKKVQSDVKITSLKLIKVVDVITTLMQTNLESHSVTNRTNSDWISPVFNSLIDFFMS
jgi:hypothetical protein